MTETTTSKTLVASLLAMTISSGACVVPIDVAGGPQRVSHRLRPDHIGEDMRPLVQDEPAARARLDEVESDARVSKVALWTGFGLLGACLLVSMASNQATMNGGSTSDNTLYSIIGLCGASIVADVVSIIYAPTKRTWGEPLRVYNQNRPQTPWASEELSVTAPLGAAPAPMAAPASAPAYAYPPPPPLPPPAAPPSASPSVAPATAWPPPAFAPAPAETSAPAPAGQRF
jgi:hypothetical protein